MSLTPQTAAVLRHIQSAGSVTGVEAAACLRVRHLPARIYELRRKGFDVVATTKRDPVGQRYVRYSLKKD